MKRLVLAGIKRPGQTNWRYTMEYETACKMYLKDVEELGFLKERLKTTPEIEKERVRKNIESREVAIRMLEKWFKFTKNKLPEIS